MPNFNEQASAAIRAAGGRMTDQRQTLIRLLADLSGRIDAETLHQQAQRLDAQINLATVYRTLDVLAAAQLIRAHYVSPDHERRYFTRTPEPYHFTCRRCRRVIAFASDLVELLKTRLEADFNVQAINACVCVDGLCPDCQNAVEQESHS